MSTLVNKIIHQINQDIQDGILLPGTRLPSIRKQAELLGVSTFTIGDAYDRLMLQGKIYSIQGKGYFVLPSTHNNDNTIAHQSDPKSTQALDESWLLQGIFQQENPMLLAGCGWLPESYYDVTLIQAALKQLAKAPEHYTQYGQPLGYQPLREQLSRRLHQWHLPIGPNEILMTQGASQALNLVIHAYLKAGDTVLVDLPAYSNLLPNLQNKGVHIVGVPWLATGPDIAALKTILSHTRAKIFFTNPSLHNPTGASYDAATTYQVLSLAQEHDFLVVENQVSLSLAYQQPMPLTALDNCQNTLFISSLSKSLSPSLRIGFIAGSADKIKTLTHQKMMASLSSSSINEQLAWHMLQNPKSQRQINSIKQKLATAQARVQAALLQAGWVLFTKPQSGLFLYARHPDIQDAFEFAQAQLEEGIALAPGIVFQLSNQQKQAWFRFNVAFCEHEDFNAWLRRIHVIKDTVSMPTL